MAMIVVIAVENKCHFMLGMRWVAMMVTCRLYDPSTEQTSYALLWLCGARLHWHFLVPFHGMQRFDSDGTAVCAVCQFAARLRLFSFGVGRVHGLSYSFSAVELSNY